jgi:Carboxypeptidase regulatory-like domain/Glycoside Hydrolase Family 113
MKPRSGAIMLSIVCLVALGTSACSLSLLQLPTFPAPPPEPQFALPTGTAVPQAQTVFKVALPEPLPAGSNLALALLDEVTGLALNAQLFPMQSVDGTTYTATLALPYRAVVKYRYMRLGASQVVEDLASGASMRYRLYFVAGPAEVDDLIARWSDSAYSGQTGSIQGRVVNADTGAPVPDLLVTAGGRRAFSDSAGRFQLVDLVPGTHNLVVYAVDGTYETFQQGATVASGLTTSVDASVRAAPSVKVTFNVSASNDVPGVPVRIAGNLLQLGNTYADLRGGISSVADRMPVMGLRPDGSYTLTLNLPAGAYVAYKYTLGDGFWNAEHTSDGAFRVREFIVPAKDSVIQDQVDTWRAGASAPILFEVTVPRDTPTGDLIYIQFNPYGWTEPLPMWPMGNDRWAYKLYGPVNTLGNLRYRYCRDAQCGSADDLSTAGPDAEGRSLQTSLSEQDIKDTVKDWAWLKSLEPSTLVGTSIVARADGFVAGVEFQPNYRPNWTYFNAQAVQSVQSLGANLLLVTPSWTFANASPLEIGPVPEHDPFWQDAASMIGQARAANLNVGVFPIAQFAASPADFWDKAPRDDAWWQNWFDHYRAFAVNFADLAAQTDAQALVLGGDWIGPALPGGTLADGSPSGVPADAEERWKAIIAEARQHFSGKLWWATPYAANSQGTSFDFAGAADAIYLMWSAPLASAPGASVSDMTARAGQLLDNEIAPLQSLLGKPLVLGLTYPSAVGGETACLSDGEGGCLSSSALDQPNDPAAANVDLQVQADIYEAMLEAVNSRSFISGLISRGYYPPATLQDKSTSIHGKPAADLLWYWFPRLTGVVK